MKRHVLNIKPNHAAAGRGRLLAAGGAPAGRGECAATVAPSALLRAARTARSLNSPTPIQLKKKKKSHNIPIFPTLATNPMSPLQSAAGHPTPVRVAPASCRAPARPRSAATRGEVRLPPPSPRGSAPPRPLPPRTARRPPAGRPRRPADPRSDVPGGQCQSRAPAATSPAGAGQCGAAGGGA